MAEPDELGRLRGREGFFASRFAQRDRAHAMLAAPVVGHSLIRIAEAEQRAAREYREAVTAQLTRDAVGIPKLSAAATAVLESVLAARAERSGDPWLARSSDRAAVAQAWETGQRNPAVAAEIDRFEQAAEQRLGPEGIGEALRSVSGGGGFSVPGTSTRQRATVQQLARGVAAARWGRTDHEVHRALEAYKQGDREHQRMVYRRGLSLGR